MPLTREQLELRRSGIGASEIAAIAGLSRWTSPAHIYASKVLGWEKEQTLQMELGDLFEAPIAEVYSRRTGRIYLTNPGTIRSGRHAFALATPDRCVHSGPQPRLETEDWGSIERLLQVKNHSWRLLEHYRDPDEDPTGLPQDELAQVTWEMGVSGVGLCDVAVLFDRSVFWIYTVPFDDQYFNALVELGARFWTDHVLTRRPPPPDASASYANFLKTYYPEHTPGSILKVADPQLAASVERLRMLELVGKRLEEEVAKEKNVITSAIGEAEGLETARGVVTWKRTRGSTNTKWEKAARDVLQGMLGALCPNGPTDEQMGVAGRVFRAAVDGNTVVTKGHRRLHKPWSREKLEDQLAEALPDVARKVLTDGT